MLADEVERAESLIADIRADARARGSIDAHLTALTWGALLALRRGDLPRPRQTRASTLEIATRHEVLWTKIWSAAILVRALIERGELDEADGVLAPMAAPTSALGSAAVLHALFARGRLRVAQGRRAEAIADLRAPAQRDRQQPELCALALDSSRWFWPARTPSRPGSWPTARWRAPASSDSRAASASRCARAGSSKAATPGSRC